MAYKVFSDGNVLPASDLNTYLMKQSVMTFASTTARDAALTSPTEGMLVWLEDSDKYVKYTGTAWADLVTGNGANAIINGAFDIWQRGTSFTNPGSSGGATVYTADRWGVAWDGSGATRTLSQQTFTPGAAPVAGYEGTYYLRNAVTVAGSGSTYNSLNTPIEDVRTFAGQTVTLSFWAKAAATTTVRYITVRQNFGTGGSALVEHIVATNLALSTSWTRYTYTVALTSISGKTIGANSNLMIEYGLPLNSTNTIDLWGVQLEAGSTATTFKRNAPSIQAELAACQRYYFRATAEQAYSYLSLAGYADGTTTSVNGMSVPVKMRVNPTSVEYSGIRVAQGTTNYAVSAIGVSGNSSSASLPVVAATTSGLTSNTSYILRADNNSSAYIGLSAEL